MPGMNGTHRFNEELASNPFSVLFYSQDAVVSLESSTQCDADDDGLLDVYKEGLSSDFRQTPWKKPSKGAGALGALVVILINHRALLRGSLGNASLPRACIV